MSNQIEQIRAEIERRIKELPACSTKTTEGAAAIRHRRIYEDFLSFIDALPAQPVPADVQEAAEITHDEGMELADDYNHYLATGLTEGWERPIGPKWMMKFAKKRFLAGAEYQRRQDQSLIELAEDHAMLAGMDKMKEKMMKNAMECNVIWYDGRLLDFTQEQLDTALDKIGAGVDAKVSVIIIKKDK